MRFASLACLIGLAAPQSTPTTPPAPQRVVLVELFTSEGCSSCPPADQLLRQIDGRHNAAGTLIVGISEHVTYWDHDGWKDPFSAEAMTARQHIYGQRFSLDSVYTPQMVVNGESQFVGGDTRSLQQALDKAHTADSATLQIGEIKLSADGLQTAVSLAGPLPTHGAELFAVIAEDETTQHIPSGENAGRTLAHTSVARTIVELGKVRAPGETPLALKLPPADAGTRRHLIVWAQEPGLGRVLAIGSRPF